MWKMRRIVHALGAIALAVAPLRSFAGPIADNGGNYTTWTNGSNQGTGLNAWGLTGGSDVVFNIVAGTADGTAWQASINDANPGGFAQSVRTFSGLTAHMTMSMDFDSSSPSAQIVVAENSAAHGHGGGYYEIFQVAPGTNGDYSYSNESHSNADTGIADNQWIRFSFTQVDAAGDYSASVATLGGATKNYAGSFDALFNTADTFYSSIQVGPASEMINNLSVTPEPNNSMLLCVLLIGCLLRRRPFRVFTTSDPRFH